MIKSWSAFFDRRPKLEYSTLRITHQVHPFCGHVFQYLIIGDVYRMYYIYMYISYTTYILHLWNTTKAGTSSCRFIEQSLSIVTYPHCCLVDDTPLNTWSQKSILNSTMNHGINCDLFSWDLMLMWGMGNPAAMSSLKKCYRWDISSGDLWYK